MKIWIADNAALENYFGCLYQRCDCLYRPRPFFWWILPPLGIDTELGAGSALVRLLSALDWQNCRFDSQFILSCHVGFRAALKLVFYKTKRSSEKFFRRPFGFEFDDMKYWTAFHRVKYVFNLNIKLDKLHLLIYNE